MLKEVVRRTPIADAFNMLKLQQRNRRAFQLWEKNGKPIPPPHVVKQYTIKQYARRFNVDVLIETGTCYGDMVFAMKGFFKSVYSIELSEELAQAARARFSRHSNVQILQGDSPRVLAGLLPSVEGPTLFWLDAHYSAGNTARGELDTPITQELNVIFEHPHQQNLILIDDARDFKGLNGYPAIEELEAFMKEQRPRWVFQVKDDIIRFHPPALGD